MYNLVHYTRAYNIDEIERPEYFFNRRNNRHPGYE